MTDQTVDGRVIPAGAGALRYAVIWMVGAVTIGLFGHLVMQVYPQPSDGYTATVIIQAIVILTWLCFVVLRATRGGRFTLDGDTLRYRMFIGWKTCNLVGSPRHRSFVTHIQGTTYVNGPALTFATSAGEITIAAIGESLGIELGVLPSEDTVVNPTLVIEPNDFAQIARRMR